MYTCDYLELDRCLKTFMNEDGVDTELEITESTRDTLRGYEVFVNVEASKTTTYGFITQYDDTRFALLINLRSGSIEIISKALKIRSIYNRVLNMYYDLKESHNLIEESQEYFDYEVDRIIHLIENLVLEQEDYL